ncbi:hypothetical protein F4860DRAFT_514016 [Xylaria cubensis]|nr:hypothetical protein F4860DRAFT_514016 [Xylaria cubensis]
MPDHLDPINILVEALTGEEQLLRKDPDFNVNDGNSTQITQSLKVEGPELTDQDSTGGFSVLDDHESIKVKAPSGSTKLYFDYVQHPRNDSGSLQAKTPLVRWNDRIDPKMTRDNLSQGYEDVGVIGSNQNPKPSYSAFVYQRAGLPQESSNASEKFVFTGSTDTKIGTFMVKNVFVPLEALRIRLNGTRRERLVAYTQDWITFCNYVFDGGKPEQGFKNVTAANSGFDGVTNHENAKYLKDFNGRHLKVRSLTGAYDPKEARNFLFHLLQPSGNDKCTDLPLFIFRRWCAVAYAAAILPKEPYSVSARFWKWPKSLESQITFIYDKPKNITDYLKSLKATHSSAFGGIQFSELDPEEIWKAAITDAHNQAKKYASMTLTKSLNQDEVSINKDKVDIEPPYPGIGFRDLTISKEKWEAEHVRLGSHPQQFFTIWIEREHELLKGHYFTLDGVRDPPGTTLQGSIDNYDDGKKVIPSKHMSPTITRITQGRIESAGNFPRCKTQAAVMGGVSATEVARKIWPNINHTRVAEWLHRSAYSYGGLETVKIHPDTSQTVENLMFGTYEAYLKRMAPRLEKYAKNLNTETEKDYFAITLETTPKPPAGWNDPIPSWLVAGLDYKWEIPIGSEGSKATQKHCFNTFSRSYPMRFEVEMDKCFEDYFFGDKGQDKTRRAFLWLWMLAQAEGVSNDLD